jgi:hypothetical protein
LKIAPQRRHDDLPECSQPGTAVNRFWIWAVHWFRKNINLPECGYRLPRSWQWSFSWQTVNRLIRLMNQTIWGKDGRSNRNPDDTAPAPGIVIQWRNAYRMKKIIACCWTIDPISGWSG